MKAEPKTEIKGILYLNEEELKWLREISRNNLTGSDEPHDQITIRDSFFTATNNILEKRRSYGMGSETKARL